MEAEGARGWLAHGALNNGWPQDEHGHAKLLRSTHSSQLSQRLAVGVRIVPPETVGKSDTSDLFLGTEAW